MSDATQEMTLLIDADHLQQRIQELARQMEEVFVHEEPVLVIVLKGGFLFGADLIKALHRPWPMAFVSGRASDPVMAPEDQAMIRGRSLILVDTLLDQGGSQHRLRAWLARFAPKVVQVAVLLHKTVGSAPMAVDYVGYEVPDVRLVGYGLDEEQHHRGLPAVYAWRAAEPLSGKRSGGS